MTPRQSRRARIRLLQERAAPSRHPVICDVGANPVHVPPYEVLKRLGACTVVGFEPQKEAFEALVAQAAENEHYVNAALGARGPAVLHLYPQDGFSSLYRLSRAALRWLGQFEEELDGERTVPVSLQGLDEVAEVPPVDLLKIDVQGAERDIIASGRAKLAEAVCVIPEMRYFPLYEGEPAMADLDAELRAQGFAFHKFLDTKSVVLPHSQSARMYRRANRSQVIDGDVVYLRGLDDPEALSDDQIKCHALFAAAVYDSHDVAIRFLDMLVARGAIDADVPSDYVDLLPDELVRRPAAAPAEAAP